MKKLSSTFLFFFLSFITFTASSQDLGFLSSFGGINDDRVTNLVPGSDGNIYLLGQTSDTLKYYDLNNQLTTINPILSNNYFVTCVNSTGKIKWTFIAGVSAVEHSTSRIAIGDNGKVYFLLGSDDYIKTNTDSINANGVFHQEMFEITNNGTIVSHKPFLDVVGRGDITTIKTDSLYNLYVTGTFQNELYIYNNTGTISDTLLPSTIAGKSAFLLKYNHTLDLQYNKQLGNIINDFGVNFQNKLFMLCEVNYGTHLMIENIDLTPFNQLRQQYIIELTSTGNYIRHKEIGNTTGYEFRFVSIFSNPDGYELFGSFNQSFTLDTMHINSSLPINLQNSTFSESFVVRLKYNNLDYKLYHAFKIFNEDLVFYQPDSKNGYNYLLYTALDTLSYDTLSNSYQFDGNMFLNAYSPTFNKMWGVKFGTQNTDYPQGLILDHNNVATVYGIFKDTLSILDSTLFRTNGAIVSNGGDDIFIGQYYNNSIINFNSVITNSPEVYPNPCNNVLYIVNGEKMDNLKLSDVMGKIVLKFSSSNIIDLSTLKSGVYFLTYSNNNKLVCKKVIKQ